MCHTNISRNNIINFMIPTFFLYLISSILGMLNYFLPTWTIWPASVERGAQLIGQWSYWLDPWIPMKDFWTIIIYDATFASGLLFACIFSRSLRLKIFKH